MESNALKGKTLSKQNLYIKTKVIPCQPLPNIIFTIDSVIL